MLMLARCNLRSIVLTIAVVVPLCSSAAVADEGLAIRLRLEQEGVAPMKRPVPPPNWSEMQAYIEKYGLEESVAAMDAHMRATAQERSRAASDAEIEAARKAVSEELVDPSSLLITDTFAIETNGTYVIVCGNYNARNRMGGYAGKRAFNAGVGRVTPERVVPGLVVVDPALAIALCRYGTWSGAIP